MREADGKPFRFEPGKACQARDAHFLSRRLVSLLQRAPEGPAQRGAAVAAMGIDVLFLSTDRPEILRSSLKEPVDYHLLSDNEVNAARAFGIAYRMDDATYAKYKTYGLDLEESQGAKHHELPVPAVFIVDRERQDPLRAHQCRLHAAPPGAAGARRGAYRQGSALTQVGRGCQARPTEEGILDSEHAAPIRRALALLVSGAART